MSAQPLEIRMAHLEGAYEQINERLRSIEGRLETRFDGLDRRIDARFDALDTKFTGLLVTVLGGNAVVLAAIIGAILTLHR